MKKCFLLLMIIVMITLIFSGCVEAEHCTSVSENGSGQIYRKISINKSSLDLFLSTSNTTIEDLRLGVPSIHTIEGEEYYTFENKDSFNNLEELKELLANSEGYSDIYVNEDGIRFVVISTEIRKTLDEFDIVLDDSIKVHYSISMPTKIEKTTGLLSEDKRSATFVYKGNDIYSTHDVMVSTAEETKKPTLSGVTSKKTYGSAKTVIAKDASGIKTAKYKRNDGKYYSFKADLQKTFTKNGKYTVYATDYYGNKMVKTFTIKDTTRPTVSGVTSGKTYSSEQTLYFEDNCEVKSVKCYIDGERATLPDDYLVNGVLASESGAYKFVVTDVNGNTRTVKFKIK